ncbi:MAG: aspartate aminotransferase family protein [Saprospiraceae bacterium]|nr:aspartate aminotransferase family protein [Saprospiraceae bacterium]
MSEQQLSLNTKKSTELHESDQAHYLPTFKRMPIAFEKGKGCKLWDVDGNKYLDALAGIAVNSLGHAHPKVSATIKEQADKLLHVSNFFVTRPQVQLSQELTQSASLDHVFFTNSGTESFEGAVKIARKYAHSKGRGGTVLSMHNCFHGRTMAAIAAGKPKMQKGFDPIPAGFKQIPFNDIDAFKKEMDNDIAAVVIEPIQGEGGIIPADLGFVQDLRYLCSKNDIVLIFDEIQCGMGRTGRLFAHEHFGVKPDIMTLAKALGNGMPVGAILSNEEVSDAIEFGDHGTTFGGNPIACATALTVLQEINQEDFLEEVEEKGNYLIEKLIGLKNEMDVIKEVRGMGLMVGVEFEFETAPLVMKMLDKGVVANATAQNVLRLVPPLIISEKEIDQLLAVIYDSVVELQKK